MENKHLQRIISMLLCTALLAGYFPTAAHATADDGQYEHHTVNAAASDITITTQPKGATVGEGTNVTFTVAATGENLTYQWQYRAAGTKDWKNTTLSGAKTATLKVTATQARSGIVYRCIITDGSGKSIASDGAQLSVYARPEITRQPKNVVAMEGEKIDFNVGVSGHGVTCQWQYRASPTGTWKETTLPGAKTAMLKVVAATVRNGYQYRCVVTDAYGNKVTSYAASLTVNAVSKDITITTQPKGATVGEGTNVTFTVAATGENLTYQWQYRAAGTKDWKNTTLSGAKTATLKVTATRARSGIVYRCIITDGSGKSVASDGAQLSVYARPEITRQPKNVVAMEGEKIDFNVGVSGHGVTCQWQYRASPTGTWKETTLPGAKTAMLRVVAATVRNGYQYRCVVTDAYGNKVTSYAASLTVNAVSRDITITTQPKGATVGEGTNVTFTVAATGENLTYQWQYRAAGTRDWKNTTLSSAKTATLKVTATRARSGIVYRCIITDGSGKSIASDGAQLSVYARPEITRQPKNVVAMEGEKVDFNVGVSGHGVTCQWQYRASPTGTWKETTLSGAKTAMLRVVAATVRNGYQYRCVVTDAYGNKATSYAATLTVK